MKSLILNTKSVLICDNSESKSLLKNIFQETGCKIEDSETVEDIIERLRFKTYDIIIINENFEPKNLVLSYIQEMPMSLRRGIFIVLLSKGLKTDDGLAALSKSVNMIINKEDLKDIISYLEKSINENNRFYIVFQETLTKIGKK
jgi:DNA-binding NtrC family response regulator